MRFCLATLTPNPALDVSGSVKALIPNEKNTVSGERRDPGGNVLNAARIAVRLGAKPIALGFYGGATGDELRALLQKEKVPCRLTRIQGQTRVNVTVTREDTHQQTRLSFPGPKVQREEVRALLEEIDRLRPPGLLLLGGSLPPGVAPNFLSQVGRRASRRGLGVVLDAPAPVLQEALEGFTPLLIKPNRKELEDLLGARFRNDDEIAAAACRLTSRSALVCVSLGSEGAILAARGLGGVTRAWKISSPPIQAKGTVGAGDSLVGGLLTELGRAGILRPADVENLDLSAEKKGEIPPKPLWEALRTGLAAGAATAESAGTSLGRLREIRRLRPHVRVARAFAEC